MPFFTRIPLLALMLSAIISCNPTVKPEDVPSTMKDGKVYFLQVAMHQENGHSPTTNYGVGELIPVNTKANLGEMKKKSFSVVASGAVYEFSNNPGHTHDTLPEAFAKLFAEQPVDLDQFTDMEKKNILAGNIAEGMSKEAVLVARGYPPGIATPSLNSDQWKYWWNRWKTFYVMFKDGRVIEVTETKAEQ